MFGDILSVISDTTIAATKGVGAEKKDKFRMNLLIALPAALVAAILDVILSNKEHFGNYRGIVFKNHAADDRIPHFSK